MHYSCGRRYGTLDYTSHSVCNISLAQIRGAIQEYQTQLIDSVKEDIKRLHDKVRNHLGYPNANLILP